MNMLPTQKLYQLMKLDEYNEELQRSISSLSENYAQKSVEEKWDLLLEKFQVIALAATANVGSYVSFQAARKNTSNGTYNLTLEKCLMFFENLHFLYTTEDPRFKLSKAQKKLLLEAINDAMGTCETGISLRFELVLQQYRTDLDWVIDALSKTRSLLVVRLQSEYNSINKISPSLQVHVLKLMTKLAIARGLGIKIENQIEDAHASLINEQEITQYFNQNYLKVFTEEYDEVIVDILSQDLVLKLQDLFCPNWATTAVEIPSERVEELTRFINDRIALDDENIRKALGENEGILYKLGELSDDSLKFKIKTRDEVLVIIRSLIKQKLVVERFFIPFEEVRSDNSLVLNSLHLREGITSSLLIELNEAFLNYREDNAPLLGFQMETNSKVLLQYPGLLLSHIARQPELLSLVPKSLKKNAYFTEKTLSALDEALLIAINDENELNIEELTSHILRIVKNDADYLSVISKKLLSNVRFTKRLVETDGLLLKHLPDELKQNDEIITIAVKQNPLALLYMPEDFKERVDSAIYYRQALQHEVFSGLTVMEFNHDEYVAAIISVFKDLHTSLPKELKLYFSVPYLQNLFFTDIEDREKQLTVIIENMKNIKAIHKLIAPTKLSTSSVANLVQSLTPEILKSIIRVRKQNKWPSLPYCENESVVERFSNALLFNQINNWQKGYLFVKKKACELDRMNIGGNDHYQRGVITSMVNTDYWYIAMLHYQRQTYGAFNNFNELWEQTKRVAKAIFNLFRKMLNTAIDLIYGYISFIISIYLLSLISLTAFGGMFMAAILAPFLIQPVTVLFLLLCTAVLPNSLAARIMRMPVEPILNTVYGLSALIIGVLFSPEIIVGISFWNLYKNTEKLFKLGVGLATSIQILVVRLFNTIFSEEEYVNEINPDADFKTNLNIEHEEKLIGLRLIDTPDALQKADLLEIIWNKINLEVEEEIKTGRTPEEQANDALKLRLHMKYLIAYQGNVFKISYLIASRDKVCLNEFVTPSKTGFFKAHTEIVSPLQAYEIPRLGSAV